MSWAGLGDFGWHIGHLERRPPVDTEPLGTCVDDEVAVACACIFDEDESIPSRVSGRERSGSYHLRLRPARRSRVEVAVVHNRRTARVDELDVSSGAERA